MIRKIIHGDITDPKINSGDIIIGMNTKLEQVSALGRPFAKTVDVMEQLNLGSVLSFPFEEGRQLHMIICHKLGNEGWVDSIKFVRYCLDYLWQMHNDRSYGIVEIGNGAIGRRDGADVPSLRTAIATSWLDMDLFILPERNETKDCVSSDILVPTRIWDMKHGEREIRVH